MGNFQKKWCVKKRFFGNLFKAKEFFRLFTPESFSDRGTGGVQTGPSGAQGSIRNVVQNLSASANSRAIRFPRWPALGEMDRPCERPSTCHPPPTPRRGTACSAPAALAPARASSSAQSFVFRFGDPGVGGRWSPQRAGLPRFSAKRMPPPLRSPPVVG